MNRSEIMEAFLVRTLRQNTEKRGSPHALSCFDDPLDIHLPAAVYLSSTDLGLQIGLREHPEPEDNLSVPGKADFEIFPCASNEATVGLIQLKTILADEQVSLVVPPEVLHGCQIVDNVATLLPTHSSQIYLL